MKKYIPKPGVPTPSPVPPSNNNEKPRYKTQPVKPEPTPKPKPKPKPKKIAGVKRRDVSDEQIKPRRTKPTPNRRRFLDELNEMNKRGGK